MVTLIVGVLLYFTSVIEGTSIVSVGENDFLMKELNGSRNIFFVAGKIESQVYIQFYENDTQVIEILLIVNNSGYVMDYKRCASTGMSVALTDVDFRWIWVKWTGNKLFVGLGKTDDNWGISRLDNFSSRPTSVVFLSDIALAEWIFEEPIPRFHQNMYTKTGGRRGGEVGEKIKTVSVLACLSRCTQDNKCVAANFSPNENELNCELILLKAKFVSCYDQNPNKLKGYTSSTQETNWNLYMKQ